MARGENSELLVSLRLEDNLSGPMKAAKDSVDQTASATERLGNKIEDAGGKLRTFRRIGGEVGQVGRALGGGFEDATNAIDQFITTAGSAGLAIRGIAEVAPVAGLGLAAIAAPLAVLTVGVGAFVIAAQRQVTVLEQVGTRAAVTATQINLLNRAYEAGQLLPSVYAARVAMLVPATRDMDKEIVVAAAGLHDLDGAIGLVSDGLTGVSEIVHRGSDFFKQFTTDAKETGAGLDIVAQHFQTVGINANAAADATLRFASAEETAARNANAFSLAQSEANKALSDRLRLLGEAPGAGISGSLQHGFLGAQPFESIPTVPIVPSTPAVTKAKSDATDLANVYKDRVQAAFEAAKRVADTLFDALHRRNLQAIDDAEKLAQTRHDNTAQAIADELKLEQASHAAPVLAAQQALNDRQAIQQRRDLVEAEQAAAQALQKNTDPANTQGLARALRAATEALQNFDASATIGRLQDIQQQQDAASEQRARVAAGINDAELAAAKQAADIARDAETIADQKRRQRFDLELAALQKRDEALKKSPAAIQQDIEALQAKFGITIDPITGFHHITDPLVTAIKNVHIEPPKVTLIQNNTYKLQLGANELRLLGTAISSTSQPQSTASSRTGNARG